MKCKSTAMKLKSKVYCPFHFMVYRNVLEKFGAWKKASGLVWMKYLNKIQKNSLTGEWAKEVVKQLIKEENEKCPAN